MASLRQLEYLVAIVEEGSFTAAAARLHVTQPGLSHQFQGLEQEVGGLLVERLPRGVRPTPAGRAMLPHARLALSDAARATSAGRRANGVASGELQVSTLYSVSLGVMPRAIGLWRRQHPNLRIHLFEHRRASEQAAGMLAGEADIAIGPLPDDWGGPSQQLGSEEFVVVTAADEVAGRDGSSIRLAELADREWVQYTPASGLQDILEAACAAADFVPRVAMRTEQAPTAISFAGAGIGPALVPANTIPAGFPGALLRPDPPVQRTLASYARASPDPIALAFSELLVEHALLVPAHIRTRLGI
jgi:DNA-binding transcriptional LysR family regulator